MIPCEWFKENIFDYIDDELDSPKRQKIEEHLKECPMCTKFYSSLKSLKKGLKQMKPVRAPDSFQVVLRERLRREMAHKRGFGLSPSPFIRWMPLYTSVCIIFGMLFILIDPFDLFFRPDTSTTQNGQSMTDEDYQVQYVIDDLEIQRYTSPHSIHHVYSPIDSLLEEEPKAPIHDLYQLVRF